MNAAIAQANSHLGNQPALQKATKSSAFAVLPSLAYVRKMKRAVVRVEEFEVKFAEYPDAISSGGLGPCIAVGVFFKNRAYMLHSPFPHCEECDSNGRHAFFNLLEREISIGERERAGAIVIGGQLGNEANETASTMAAREFVQIELARLGFSEPHVEWCPSGRGLFQELEIDTATGEARIAVSDAKRKPIKLLSQRSVTLRR